MPLQYESNRPTPMPTVEGADLLLSERERVTLEKYLSNTLSFPKRFKTWILDYVSTNMGEIPLTQITGVGSVVGYAPPPGSILPYAGTSAPTNWLLCDGTAVSRTTYATLFAVVGTTYGPGDGSTTFNLPDLRGRAPVGVGLHASVTAPGANEGLAAATRSPYHGHSIPQVSAMAGGPEFVDEPFTDVDGAPAFLALHFIIRT